MLGATLSVARALSEEPMPAVLRRVSELQQLSETSAAPEPPEEAVSDFGNHWVQLVWSSSEPEEAEALIVPASLPNIKCVPLPSARAPSSTKPSGWEPALASASPSPHFSHWENERKPKRKAPADGEHVQTHAQFDAGWTWENEAETHSVGGCLTLVRAVFFERQESSRNGHSPQ